MSNTPEPAYGGQPPQQQPYGGQPPPRKRRKWPIVLGILALLTILGIAGCVAIIGGAAKSIDDSVTESEERAAPREVTEGTAFTVGSHETLAGWKVKKDTSLGDAQFNITGKVKNTSDKTSTAFIHFKFLTTSGEVLGNVQCNSSDLEPGQTETLNCLPDGKFGKYVKITAEATF